MNEQLLRVSAIGFLLGLIGLGVGCTAESGSQVQPMPRDSVDQETSQLLWHSEQAVEQGEFIRALDIVERAVSRVPRLPDAHYQRGYILSHLRRYDEAKISYLEVAKLDPTYDQVWHILGNNALQREEFKEARNYYERQAELCPSSGLYIFIGVTHEAMGEIELAREAFSYAVELDSTNSTAYSELARLYSTEGFTDQAVTYSRRASELEPENPEFRYALGVHLIQSNRLEEGIFHLEKVVEQQPDYQGAHYNLGRALLRMGRSDEGREHLIEAERLK